MDTLTLNAYAKINLSLDVLGSRPDGFHEVEMVMQSISLADMLQFKSATDLQLTCSAANLAVDESNLVLKAAQILQSRYNVRQGAAIHLTKNIPLAAGLAGGSTDAAATLWGLNILWDLRLTPGELLNLGSQIGSDIPFCLLGGTALAQGRGERLTTLPMLPKMWLVLIKPDFEVSTKEIYHKWDECKAISPPSSPKLLKALERGDENLILAFLSNQLEEVTTKLHPEVQEIKQFLLKNGAKRAVMSGSGPTVYGIMEGKEAAERVAYLLKKTYYQVYVVHTL